MTIRRSNRGVVAHVAVAALVAALTAGTPTVWAAGPVTSAKPATSLTVSSEPAGAAVYVDGTRAGETPLSIEGVTSGDHTVRLVKDGYLENSRVVSVPAIGRSLQVRLTPTKPRPYAAMQVEEEPFEAEGGGGGKKWLWIGLGAVAVGAGLALALGGNKAPSVSTVTADPPIALQGATEVQFSTNASDPDGDSLTYKWNFGDGGSAEGASPVHVFQTAGVFDVSVEVSDGKDTTSQSTSVDVRGMSGGWGGAVTYGSTYRVAFSMNLSQNGSTVTGSYRDEYGTGSVSGTVTHAFGISLTVNQPPYSPFTFNGETDGDVNSASGTVPGWFSNMLANFSMNRQ